MIASGHVDTFARDHLPPREQWPDFLLERPELRYPARLNAAVNDALGAAGGSADTLEVVDPDTGDDVTVTCVDGQGTIQICSGDNGATVYLI